MILVFVMINVSVSLENFIPLKDFKVEHEKKKNVATRIIRYNKINGGV